MKSAVLVVLDGFGVAPPGPGNAIELANPQFYKSLLHRYPNTTLKASGEAVGLPAGEAGNTEVGHINLGAGRIVYQDLPRINMSIADGSFYTNRAFLTAAEHVKQTGGKLHFLGLIGAGSVHSNIDHFYALLHFAKEQGVQQVYLHAITDGRDSPPKSAQGLLQNVEERMKSLGVGTVASVMGRYYAMDRDHRWERTEAAYRCLVQGSESRVRSSQEVITNAYNAGKTDEFIEPTNVLVNNQPVLIAPGDSVIFFNFRIDRPRQLTKAFVLDDFEKTANFSESYDPYEVKYHQKHMQESVESANPIFTRGPKVQKLCFVTMTEYEKHLPVEIAFPQIVVNVSLGQVLASRGLPQLRMSESEKERFVTFYFNGQRETPFAMADRIIIPSPHIATYDLKPEMSALELTEELIKNIMSQKYSFILINFANPDMVGHTGNIQATVSAIQTIDTCLQKIISTATAIGSAVFITGDHGNAERKIDPKTGGISTEHTDNPVPFVAVAKEYIDKNVTLQTGILADMAPTILAYLGIPKPAEMTGRNLLEEIRS